ncbi:MAG: hypothetical protein R3B81_09130 [bacterium]
MNRSLPVLTTALLMGLAALGLAACSPSPRTDDAPAPAAGPVLPFQADDYGAALAEARARDLPLFVESWAPW